MPFSPHIIFKSYYSLIEKEIRRIPLPHSRSTLYEPVRYSLSTGGKRIRPLLVLLGCRISGGNIRNALKPAVGIELFHNFTLLHDDIMDVSPLRRGRATVFKKWDISTAILAGDVMLIKAYEYFFYCRKDVLPIALRTFSKAATRVCEGQALDMYFEKTGKVTIADYLSMISLKTATLISASLEIGALLGKATPKEREYIAKAGHYLGMAFQLQDDLLDVFPTGNTFGKKTGGDILSNKKTFLSIKAMELAGKRDKRILLNNFSASPDIKSGKEKKIRIVREIFMNLEINKCTINYINRYYIKSLSLLRKVNRPGIGTDILEQLISQLMTRTR